MNANEIGNNPRVIRRNCELTGTKSVRGSGLVKLRIPMILWDHATISMLFKRIFRFASILNDSEWLSSPEADRQLLGSQHSGLFLLRGF